MHEPVARRRFDERGIALQTVIIIVVMLAIAGAVAGVLLNRAGQVTDDLEQSTTYEWAQVNTDTACRIAGGGATWHAVGPTSHTDAVTTTAVHDKYGTATANHGGDHCHPPT